MNIKVKLHEGGYMPERHGAFCDLATKQEERLKQGEVRTLPLGVSIVLPKDSWGFVVPRSSTCLKHGIMLSNSVGVIEPEYCGDDDEWGFPAYAVRDTVIPAGTRICQFMVMPLMPEVEFEQVESTGMPNRGGYGSTGQEAAPRCLDADGVEIKAGDTLWPVGVANARADKVTVVRVLGNRFESDGNRDDCLRYGRQYTHREPDSWAKLEADIASGTACRYFGNPDGICSSCVVGKYNNCCEIMGSDIVKRAKRLAGE